MEAKLERVHSLNWHATDAEPLVRDGHCEPHRCTFCRAALPTTQMQSPPRLCRRHPCTHPHSSLLLLSTLFPLFLLSITAPLLVCGQRLFFSFYMHSASERIVEVYNPSCYTVNLAEYAIRIAPYSSNQAGAAWGGAIPLDTTLPLPRLLSANSRVSVCRSTGVCSTPSNSALNFNGTDAVGLFHNNVLIDIIGSASDMSGELCANCPNGGRTTHLTAPWFVAGVVGATQLATLRRKPRVTEGSVDFFYPKGLWVGNVDSSEWTVVQPPTTAGLGTFTCSTCGVYCTVLHATCGTLGSDYPFLMGATQVNCPLDCLARTARPLVGGGIANVTGSGGKYAQTSPVCLAGIHAGILVLNTDAFPSTSFVPQPTAASLAAICQYAAVSSAAAYSGADSSLFPASTRMNGRPYMSYASLPSQSYTGAATRCLTSLPGSGPGFQLQILNATVCDPTNCGGAARGYCHQSTGKCLCNGGYSGSFCATKTCSPACINGGTCLASGTCSCSGIFSGEYCQIRQRIQSHKHARTSERARRCSPDSAVLFSPPRDSVFSFVCSFARELHVQQSRRLQSCGRQLFVPRSLLRSNLRSEEVPERMQRPWILRPYDGHMLVLRTLHGRGLLSASLRERLQWVRDLRFHDGTV